MDELEIRCHCVQCQLDELEQQGKSDDLPMSYKIHLAAGVCDCALDSIKEEFQTAFASILYLLGIPLHLNIRARRTITYTGILTHQP